MEETQTGWVRHTTDAGTRRPLHALPSDHESYLESCHLLTQFVDPFIVLLLENVRIRVVESTAASPLHVPAIPAVHVLVADVRTFALSVYCAAAVAAVVLALVHGGR
jgi:hypothetical protein